MAYSCVRVQFEVGHEASIRNKRTPDGFTHDWEVFVRGADNAEIHHFVDKVVFHLHETFPKPKRIFKEPPYVVKESGYAGFNLPIDIYVKTKEEGARKIRFYYDLTLQPLGTGSARISNVTREKHDFTNPAEDLRRKLIRGGGCGVGSDGIASTDKISSSSNNVSNSLNSSSNHLDESKNSPHSTTKGKGSGGEPPAKKHKAPKEPKTEESRLTNSFAELFGTPIKTVKHSPNPKPPPKPSSESKSHDKGKEPSSKVPKHSPAKEKDREKSEKDRDKRDKESEKSSNKDKERSSKDKDSHKEGEKNKEKSRKSGSSSSSVFSQKDFIKKEEDRGKKVEDVVKEKDKSSSKGESSSKTEKKHEDKKSREEKDKKDKHKKGEVVEKKEAKEVEKDKPAEKRHEVVKELVKESKDVGGGKHKPEKEEKKSKSAEKSKEKNSSETDKPKHKHKKKDKHRKDEEREKPRKKDKEKEKEVVGSSIAHEVPKGGKGVNVMPPPLVVKEKSPPSSPPPPPPPPPALVGKVSDPIKELLDEMSDQGSDSDFSGSEDMVKREIKERSPTPPPAPVPPPPPPLPAPVKIKEEKKVEVPKEEKPEKPKKRDRKGKDEDHKKRKRKHKDRDSSREEPHDKVARVQTEVTVKDEKMSPSLSTESRQSRSPSPEETLFTEDYINQLKDLQHKIMTLQDNADLQKVVQVISETGQFEITQRTFDFDLCALDPSTVKMLQDMFITA